MAKLNYPRIIEWARQRGILDQSTAQFQMLKATEEHGEMAGAILRGDRDELIDSIGDQLVVAIVQCAQLGYDVGELLQHVASSDDSVYVVCYNPMSNFEQDVIWCMKLTVAQGEVAADLARGRDARESFHMLFQAISDVCQSTDISPHEALDSVYDIISKRGGEMRNGVWVKTEDL